MARRIRLTESELRRMIHEGVWDTMKGWWDKEVEKADSNENPSYIPPSKKENKGKKSIMKKVKGGVKTGYNNLCKNLLKADEAPNPYCDREDEGVARLRNIIDEAVNDVLREGREGYFVADDGDGLYNVFSYDDFDEDGYYMGHEGEEGYHIDDFDIVYESDDFDDACLWAETAMP